MTDTGRWPGQFVPDPTARDLEGLGLVGDHVRQYFWTWYREAPSGCWEWTKSFNNKGYGQQRVHGGRTILAHRIAYALHHGGIPSGGQVLHRCDNPKCVNPQHLFIGGPSENMKDAYNKRRRVGNSGGGPAPMFTKAQVAEIRAAEGSQREIARRFGVAQSLIGKIKRGEYEGRD